MHPNTEETLKNLMARYTTSHLVGISPEVFRGRIQEFLEMQDAAMEKFKDPSKQRDLSVRFHWGHNHDFGEFQLEGRMKDRHLWLLRTFIDDFKGLPLNLEGRRVLDIGCWTGGTSLLMCAMGAEVLAIEEVRKYVDAVNFLKESFGLANLEVRKKSLYELGDPEFYDRFDYVLYAGVLYHVTDPVLSLRILFNTLKDGGKCLVETAACKSKEAVVAYEGPGMVKSGTISEMNRGGWNWFLPSPSVVKQMMEDVGFIDVQQNGFTRHRAFAVGTRKTHVDMMRGGLSVPGVR